MIRDSTIEIARGGGEPESIDLPPHWTVHDIVILREIMEAAGFEAYVPHQGMFAFRPKPQAVDVRIDDHQRDLPDLGCVDEH